MRPKDLIAAIWCPSETCIKAIVRSGMLRNCSVTIDDMDRCCKICGNVVPSLKVSTLMCKCKRVIMEVMNASRYVLDQIKNVTLEIDLFVLPTS